MSLAKVLSILSFQRTNFCFIDIFFFLLNYSFHLFSLWSLFPSFYWLLDLISLFFSSFTYTFRLFFWECYCFLMWAYITMNFSLRTAFAVSHRFYSCSVQFSHSVVSDSLQPHESQHARPPFPSPTPGVHSDSHPASQWCHPAISSSVVPFSSRPLPLPASESCSWFLFSYCCDQKRFLI